MPEIVSPNESELIVVGAGPGDPELITLKALHALKRADVVLYDNLANRELLSFTSDRCEKIYVGKKPYDEFTAQETIHALIREKTKSHGLVIRLKGGDPFIFGRGYEEILYARQLGIKASFIPGITSMQASGFEDVPLTHRNVSDGFWVMTGTKKDGALSEDLRLAIKSRATVVIYMGMKKLAQIARVFEEENAGDLPAMVLQHATLANKKVVKGTISAMPALVEEAQITHPALIIVGPVADLQNESL
jgi:uroporphyrin-III C-methyltransferase